MRRRRFQGFNMRNRTAKAFTLIEVSLAIVIGMIMMGGAILIYNQARNAAGSARAKEKVLALDAIVEKTMARNDGTIPDRALLRQAWAMARPDDFNKSPWGGIVQPTNDTDDLGSSLSNAGLPNYQPCAAPCASNGIIFGNTVPLDAADIAGFIVPSGSGAPRQAPAGERWDGALIYYELPQAGTYHIWDESRRAYVLLNSFAVCAADQTGLRWFFTVGGTTGIGESGPSGGGGFGIQGQVAP
ncbi:MAG: prepilin-type N-terminal cleavage/methylation domain-containing protein [Cyanobacteria bacterium REEB65]|nr:prepilin-type N-terminal cleavage/methylation domain-containing protein [Cyanobacteria bacterium REEB65]